MFIASINSTCLTISLSTYRTPTNTFDSLFDSLFDPFFESVTIPRKRTASMVNTKVTTEDNKHIISVAAPGLDKEDFNITTTEGTLTVQTNKTDTDITTDASSSAVIANAEQIPKTCTVIGLLSDNGSEISLASFFVKKPCNWKSDLKKL